MNCGKIRQRGPGRRIDLKKKIKKDSIYVVLWNFLLKAPWSTEYNILLEMDFSFYKESWVISELCTFSVEKKYLESN